MKRLSLIVALIASVTALTAAQLASAKDSTSGAYFTDDNGTEVSSATPSYIYGSPFIMEEGFADPYYGSANKFGYMETMHCEDETSTREAFCVVRALTYRAYDTNYDTKTANPEICPVNFLPIFSVEPQVSDGLLGKSFACPAPTGNFGSVNIGTQDRGVPQYASNYTPKGHFWMYIITSAKLIPGSSGQPPQLAPANVLNWKITCLPQKSALILMHNPSSDKCHFKTGEPKPPILWETGVVAQTSTSNGSDTIPTTKICPRNYKPYATVTMSAPNTYTNNSQTFEVLNSYAYCLSRIQEVGGSNPTRYNLTVLYTSTTTTIDKTSTSLTVNDPDEDANHPFLNIQWNLYCYPPGLNPPFDYVAGSPPSCRTNVQPYAP